MRAHLSLYFKQEDIMKADKDLIIIGAGAAGLSAAQYGSRANLSVLVIEELASGGQAIVIDKLENYPGYPEPITGYDFSQKMEEQAKKFGAEMKYGTVKSIKKENNLFHIELASGIITCSALIIATGAKHKKLGIPGEMEFSGKGVSYCATCDGPFFKNKVMLVVGGGDAACDEAMYLSKIASKVILVHRRDRFRAQKALAERVLKNEKIEVRFNTECQAITGVDSVNKVKLLNNQSNEVYDQEVGAVFIFVGSIPQTSFVGEWVDYDEMGYIQTNEHMESKTKGLFCCGDVRNTPFRQLIVAASEGAIASHYASQYIDELSGNSY
ncbi:MAG: thioredoxin-disulfide reductase [Spirochaetales bacterium]|nr:thioredoxin-disulfide reductase [Spirochaetales bacterium]